MIMPLAMSATCRVFPAGMVLYWDQTRLSIAQQWNINRRIEAMAAKKEPDPLGAPRGLVRALPLRTLPFRV